MNKLHIYDNKRIYPQLHNILKFRTSRIKEIEDFFISKIDEIEKMSKTLNKYITAFDYADKNLVIWKGASKMMFLFSHLILPLLHLLGLRMLLLVYCKL